MREPGAASCGAATAIVMPKHGGMGAWKPRHGRQKAERKAAEEFENDCYVAMILGNKKWKWFEEG